MLSGFLHWIYSIHERDQINSLREHHPLCAEQLLDGSPVRPPRTCASSLLWGHHFRECGNNQIVTCLRFPTSLLTPLFCDNCEGDFRDTLSLLVTGLWTLWCHRGHTMSAVRGYLFGTLALHSYWYLELLLAALDLWSHPCDLLTSCRAEEVHCALLTHRIRTCCVTSACLAARCVVTPWLDASWLAKLQLPQVPLAEQWLCNLPWLCGTSTNPPLAACLAACSGLCASLWESAVSPQHDFKALSRSLDVFSDWCRSAEDRKYKVKGLSATKCNRLSFFNLIFFGYHLPCLWAVAVLLGFLSTGPSRVCFWEFSARLLKSNIALKTGLVKSHLPMVPQPWWAGAGLGSSHSWEISPCFLRPCKKLLPTSSPLSVAIAEEIRLLPSENMPIFCMRCNTLSRKQKAVGATGNLVQKHELL